MTSLRFKTLIFCGMLMSCGNDCDTPLKMSGLAGDGACFGMIPEEVSTSKGMADMYEVGTYETGVRKFKVEGFDKAKGCKYYILTSFKRRLGPLPDRLMKFSASYYFDTARADEIDRIYHELFERYDSSGTEDGLASASNVIDIEWYYKDLYSHQITHQLSFEISD